MSENWSAVDQYTLIRAWVPGDGLRCTQSKSNTSRPCGEPVAVTKTVTQCYGRVGKPDPVMVAYRGGEQSRGDITITRVLCLRHVAKLFDSELGAAGDSSVEKKALEELAQRYWDQYQEIQQRLADELVEARFSVLPSGLRGKVIALVQAGESA